MEAVEKTGAGIAKYIFDTLNSYGINIQNLAVQSYDFASNMSGNFIRVHKILSDLVGHTVIYVPCQAHRTNTAVQHSCDASLIVAELFNVLEKLYVFFHGSTKRFHFLTEMLEYIENTLHLKMVRSGERARLSKS